MPALNEVTPEPASTTAPPTPTEEPSSKLETTPTPESLKSEETDGNSSTGKSIAGIQIVRPNRSAKYLNILIYGEPGVGKTILAASAQAVPEMSPVLLIDIEGGDLSLANRYPDVEVLPVQDDYQALRRIAAHLKKEKGAGYKTVIIDTLSEAAALSRADIMRSVVLENPDRDQDVPSMRDWGKNSEQVKRIARFFRDLPMHTIFTSHEQEKEDERTKITKTRPSFAGKLSIELVGFMDEVWYLYTKNVNNQAQRLLLTGPEGSKVAKDRSDKLPLVVPEPTMEKLYKMMYSKNENER